MVYVFGDLWKSLVALLSDIVIDGTTRNTIFWGVWTSIQMNIHLLAMLLFSGVPVFLLETLLVGDQTLQTFHTNPERATVFEIHDVPWCFSLAFRLQKSWPKPKHVITCHNKHIEPDPRHETRSITSSPHARHTIIHYNLYKRLKPSSVFWFCVESIAEMLISVSGAIASRKRWLETKFIVSSSEVGNHLWHVDVSHEQSKSWPLGQQSLPMFLMVAY